MNEWICNHYKVSIQTHAVHLIVFLEVIQNLIYQYYSRKYKISNTSITITIYPSYNRHLIYSLYMHGDEI